MNKENETFRKWIIENHSNFENLSDSVQNILSNLLSTENIEFLSITQRTKSIDDCIEKAKRKKYKSPSTQLTDISGIRVIVFFESDIDNVSKIIENTFNIDKENSMNKIDLLSSSEMGYRSVHYVCDIGPDRSKLREFQKISSLKFEIQVRTILQHAWAEISHDRNYKFSGKLPAEFERKLFLLSALLETADNGFDELSFEIDKYISITKQITTSGNLNIEIDSINLTEFIINWCNENNIDIKENPDLSHTSFAIDELNSIGINKLSEVKEIIPHNYTKIGYGKESVIGLLRNWMIINNPRKLRESAKIDWTIPEYELSDFKKLMSQKDYQYFIHNFDINNTPPE
jgi:GTP pyrophosphokinase